MTTDFSSETNQKSHNDIFESERRSKKARSLYLVK